MFYFVFAVYILYHIARNCHLCLMSDWYHGVTWISLDNTNQFIILVLATVWFFSFGYNDSFFIFKSVIWFDEENALDFL